MQHNKTVYVHGEIENLSPFLSMANAAQTTFCFKGDPDKSAIPLCFSSRKFGALLHTNTKRGINVATHQSREICGYAGISRERYFLIFSIMGIIQWRALHLNPLLRPEDLYHEGGDKCLFSRRKHIEEYALLFEDPMICRYCYHFYEQLCPEEDMKSLHEVVSTLQQELKHRSTICLGH